MGSRRRAAKKHTTIEFANASVHWYWCTACTGETRRWRAGWPLFLYNIFSIYYTPTLPRTVGWRFAATPRERRTPPWCPCHASRGHLVTCRDTRITRCRHQVRITLGTLKIFGFITTHYYKVDSNDPVRAKSYLNRILKWQWKGDLLYFLCFFISLVS